MKLSIRFELASLSDAELAQQRESHRRWLFLLAVIWLVLTDDAREREREHKRRLAAQQELHRQGEERRARKRRKRPFAPKSPSP